MADSVDRELSAQATLTYRCAMILMKSANAGAPHVIVGAQAEILAKAARKLWQMCEAAGEREFRGIAVDTTETEAMQVFASEIFANYTEGTLPDVIPPEWIDND